MSSVGQAIAAAANPAPTPATAWSPTVKGLPAWVMHTSRDGDTCTRCGTAVMYFAAAEHVAMHANSFDCAIIVQGV